MSRLSIRDRIREIQDDDIDQVLQRYPIKIPTYPHTKTFDVFMEDAEDAARLKVDQAGEIDDLAVKHEREKEALKTRHERESNRQKDDDDTEKEREANKSSRETNEAFSKKQAKGKDIAKKMMKSKTMKAFAKKVAKMSKVTASDLDKILPDYVSGGDIGALFGEEVEESYSRSLVNKAIKLVKSPKYFQGNMTGAIKAIEKLKKGLSDDSRVRAALQTANEHHKKNGMHTHEEGVAVIDKKTGKTLAYYDSPKMAKNFEPNQKYVKMSDKEFMDKHHPRKGGFFGRTGRIPNAKKKAMKKPIWNEGVDGDAMIDLMQKYLMTKNKGEKKNLLKQINRYQKKLGLKVTEELGANATVGDYISDFSKSDAPQFKGKSAKKVTAMAIAAFNANK